MSLLATGGNAGRGVPRAHPTRFVPRGRGAQLLSNCRPNVLLFKPAVIRLVLSPSAGILSPLALLLIKETVFLVLETRQASERQERAHKSRCPIVTCPEPGGNRARLRVPVSLWPGKRRDCVARSRGDP